MSNQFNLRWLETLVVRLQKHLALWTWTLWPLPSCNRPSPPKVKAHTRDNVFSFSSASGLSKTPFLNNSFTTVPPTFSPGTGIPSRNSKKCRNASAKCLHNDSDFSFSRWRSSQETETMNRFFLTYFFSHVLTSCSWTSTWKRHHLKIWRQCSRKLVKWPASIPLVVTHLCLSLHSYIFTSSSRTPQLWYPFTFKLGRWSALGSYRNIFSMSGTNIGFPGFWRNFQVLMGGSNAAPEAWTTAS